MSLIALFPIQTDSTATDLADRAASAHAHYSRLCCDTVVDDAAADAAMSEYCSRLAELAAVEATGPADISAKIAALEACIVHHAGQTSTIEGDCGLAASLLRDLRRPGAQGYEVDGVRALSRLIKEPICRTLAQRGREPRAAVGI